MYHQLCFRISHKYVFSSGMLQLLSTSHTSLIYICPIRMRHRTERNRVLSLDSVRHDRKLVLA